MMKKYKLDHILYLQRKYKMYVCCNTVSFYVLKTDTFTVGRVLYECVGLL